MLKFISLGLWSPHSPNLNPVDYKNWGYLRDRVYQNRSEVDQLKQHLIEVQSDFGQTTVPSVDSNFTSFMFVIN